ncbi:MAG: lysophospholipase [Oscillospiraceae bacterium]|nr:lysophospholipase [Oscillospiraceae bacterium]
MSTFQDFSFESSTGKNTIHALKCLPEGKPKAIVQIAHGIAEHIDRYRDFMAFLADNGYLAVGNDHLGHGKSITAPSEQGIFAEDNGWDYVVRDMDRLHDIMRAQYPDTPYVFFGHSMGSFLTRTYLIKHPDKYDAAIISGTGHQTPAMVNGGYAMAQLYTKLFGPHKIGTTLNNVAFGSYTKGFENPRTAYDWLSRDPAVVDKYIADPLCGFVATVSLFRDMMGGIKFLTDQSNIDTMNKDKPIYFMSGEADPVGENGKGVDRAYKAFCKAGLRDVMIRLYPGGRHEMLNEINKADVYKDILAWLNEKIG